MLTAAYCVERLKPSDFIALVGTISRIRGGTIYEINKVISHKAYNKPYKFDNDIAVISTKKTIEFNENVQPLPLPKKNIQSGLSCIVSGWGYLNNQLYSDKLKYLYVETLTSEQCSRILSNGRSSTVILPLHMCTLSKRGQGTCLSDAGSSLVCNGTSAGIVSYNFPCALGKPDLYSNTYIYNTWIKQNTKSP
ncbi:chymotrypsin-1-like [Pieris napi]|uniref:chymotrypsin-1-like n=1 Tax=Pieris napi TaxID=78633 RepID=UPI001FB8FF94|nr:chymotrypsin-1-like [Pieris napi]XP_047515506.1 chymotrypsin-1-like [Pieris napi]